MGKWINRFYIIDINELDVETIAKIDIFSKKVCNETYNRFLYDNDKRIETIKIGKIAEEIFVKFMYDEYSIKFDVNYDIYEGIDNVDKFDFDLNGYSIDIKSSKDTKGEGLENCFEKFNFPVPADQEIKDLTLSIIYSSDLKYFAICSGIFKNDYLKNKEVRSLPVGNGVYKRFNLCKLTKGISPKEAIDYIIKNKK